MYPQSRLLAKVDTIHELLTVADDLGEEPLAVVQALRMISETAESALLQAVPLARAHGATWEQLGRMLGTSRQAAHERWSALDPQGLDELR